MKTQDKSSSELTRNQKRNILRQKTRERAQVSNSDIRNRLGPIVQPKSDQQLYTSTVDVRNRLDSTSPAPKRLKSTIAKYPIASKFTSAVYKNNQSSKFEHKNQINLKQLTKTVEATAKAVKVLSESLITSTTTLHTDTKEEQSFSEEPNFEIQF
jgi:hypothetical protein